MQIFIVLSGKMELNCVNPFMPTVEGRLVSPQHHGRSNYSLQKPNLDTSSTIHCASCWIRPDLERLAFSFRALRVPCPSSTEPQHKRAGWSGGGQGRSSGSLKGCFVLSPFVSFFFFLSFFFFFFFTRDIHISKQKNKTSGRFPQRQPLIDLPKPLPQGLV